MHKTFRGLLCTLVMLNLGFLSLRAESIDSLLHVIKKQKGKQLCQSLNLLAYSYNDASQFDSGAYYANAGLNEAIQLGDELFQSKFYNQIGVSYWNKGDYTTALKKLKLGLSIAKKINNLDVLSSIYNNLGLVHWEKADYSNALTCLSKSLNLDKKLHDKEGMASSILNIGLVYDDIKDYPNALKYYSRSLTLCKELKDFQTMGICYTNLGGVYDNLGNGEKSMECYVKAVQIATKNGDKRTLALANNNIGALMFDAKKFDESIDFYLHALHLYNEAGDVSGVVLVKNNLGDAYGATGQFQKSLEAYQEARIISDSTDMLDHLVSSYQGMAKTYAQLKDYKRAYESFNKFNELKDSLNELKNTEGFNKMRTDFEVKQKEMELNAKREKERGQERAAKRQQRIILLSVAVFLVLTVVFSFFLYKRIRISQRQNKIIHQQKHLVEEKNQEIVDSINYAQRIQQALLPQEEDFARLFTYSFVLFKPKDIVSGDFYWITEKNNYIFYATADCTGHGVPGGFMSMLGTSFLNEIINEKNIIDPAEILNVLRERVIAALRQKGTLGENKDGMDLVLCRINKSKSELVYAAANNALYVYRNGAIVEHGADKMPIGYFAEMKPFVSHSVPLNKGDIIYTFTDGYPDQFGGPRGKKFKYGQLISALTSYSGITTSASGLESIKSKLLHDFQQWKGEMDQTDDVCVIGVYI